MRRAAVKRVSGGVLLACNQYALQRVVTSCHLSGLTYTTKCKIKLNMRYPEQLIKGYGSAAAFADAATAHPYAPKKQDGSQRTLDAAAVYMWKSRQTVPYMWRPVVSDMLAKAERGAA